MATIVLTNRNRDLQTVKNCLDSLENQSNDNFELFFVDYGSNNDYVVHLEQLLLKYPKINYINCPVSGQLWNKCRAINIVLQQCKTPYFFVGDIDMLFHSDFISKLHELKNENKVTYFQVGFLSEKETLLQKDFDHAAVSFTSKKEATGMTLYPTHLLKEINGYNEFYHGWGAEDTDVHIRLHNLGIEIEFYEKEILLKHQWHPKTYRTNLSTDPYHFKLERINHSYIQIAQISKQIKANLNNEWGVLADKKKYSKLESKPDLEIEIEPEISKINALLAQWNNFENKVISITVKDAFDIKKRKQLIKKALGKKHLKFVSMKNVNDLILEEIVKHYKNLPYQYSFDQNQNLIHLKIYFQ
ncbi:glycosyl transferase family 2 [Flavobacterium chryseum]|uniref:glycosyltransferase family 2 protein n=1 Tax=Flavobacterium sp. P3160 TaxID=2512113 RepID=UPI00105FEB47|nr:glycosyltransferase [Flavobacterium sp. P3160]TDO77467.1 glycosyl transferase family 2 [Flavobacterium sp. P3160]